MAQLEGRRLFTAVTTLTCLGFLLIGLYVMQASVKVVKKVPNFSRFLVIMDF
jgi:hypothetical protein